MRWLSGRKQRFAKAPYPKRVPRVRIPPSPFTSQRHNYNYAGLLFVRWRDGDSNAVRLVGRVTRKGQNPALRDLVPEPKRRRPLLVGRDAVEPQRTGLAATFTPLPYFSIPASVLVSGSTASRPTNSVPRFSHTPARGASLWQFQGPRSRGSSRTQPPHFRERGLRRST